MRFAGNGAQRLGSNLTRHRACGTAILACRSRLPPRSLLRFARCPLDTRNSVVAFACGKGRHRRPATQRALRALGTAALVAACGSIAFGASSILPYLPRSCKSFAQEKEKLFLIYYCKNRKMML